MGFKSGTESFSKTENSKMKASPASELKGRWGFLGGAVDSERPASVGDVGSSTGPGGFHRRATKPVLISQLLSLCSRAREPHPLKPTGLEPRLYSKKSRRNKKPVLSNEE